MQVSIDEEDDDSATLLCPRLAGIVYQLVHTNETLDKAKQHQVKAIFVPLLTPKSSDISSNEKRV